MNTQPPDIVRIESQQIGILRIVFVDCEHRDKAIGRECDQLIFEQIDQHDWGGHLDYFRISIVQLAVFWINAELVALLHQTVATH